MTIGIDALAYLYDSGITSSRVMNGMLPMLLSSTHALTNEMSIAPYFEAVLHVGPVEVTMGSRFDVLRTGVQTSVLPEPRAVIHVRLANWANVVASSGLFHQLPLPTGPTYFPPNGVVDSAGLLPERAWQSSLGVELKLPLAIEARVTGFFNHRWQITGGAPPFYTTTESDIQGNAYGLEVLIRRRLVNGIYAWLAYTLSRSELQYPGMAPDLGPYDQTHILSTAMSWQITAHWRAGARFQLSSGRAIAVVHPYLNADMDTPSVTSGAHTDRSPFFNQLDLRVDYLFRLGPARMKAFLDIINVYDYSNSEYWVYSSDYRYRWPGGGIPILPTIGIGGEL